MEDELYNKLKEKLSDGLDENAKKRIDEAISTGYKIGINTFAHNFGNTMQDAIYANDLYVQNPTGEDTRKYMSLQRKGLGKLSSLIKILLNTDLKNLKIEKHPPENLENYMVNTKEVLNENGKSQNGDKQNGK